MNIGTFLKILLWSVVFVVTVFFVSELRFHSLMAEAGINSNSVIINQDKNGQKGVVYYLNDRHAPRPAILNDILLNKKSVEISVTPSQLFIRNDYAVMVKNGAKNK